MAKELKPIKSVSKESVIKKGHEKLGRTITKPIIVSQPPAPKKKD